MRPFLYAIAVVGAVTATAMAEDKPVEAQTPAPVLTTTVTTTPETAAPSAGTPAVSAPVVAPVATPVVAPVTAPVVAAPIVTTPTPVTTAPAAQSAVPVQPITAELKDGSKIKMDADGSISAINADTSTSPLPDGVLTLKDGTTFAVKNGKRVIE